MKKTIKESIIYLMLGFLAKKLVSLFSPIGLIYAIIRIAIHPRLGWDQLRIYLMNVAVAADQLGNAEQGVFYNDIMLKRDSEDWFGFPDETLSSVFGKNKRSGTLTKFGSVWSYLLNKVEKNHVEMAIEDDEGSKEKKI